MDSSGKLMNGSLLLIPCLQCTISHYITLHYFLFLRLIIQNIEYVSKNAKFFSLMDFHVKLFKFLPHEKAGL